MPIKIRLGDSLLAENLITSEQLDAALERQKNTGRKLGKSLVDLGFLDEDTLLSHLSSQLKIPFVGLKNYDIDPEKAHLLAEKIARRFRALVLSEKAGTLMVGMSDPLDLMAIDEINNTLKVPTSIVLVRDHELLASIDVLYRRTAEISGFAEELSKELKQTAGVMGSDAGVGSAEQTLVQKLLSSVFEDAIQMRASDIHIEPGDKLLRIRQRIDGILYEQVMEESDIASALAQRLKLMAGLNIAEKRLPQDGRFDIKIHGKTIDVRLSTLPTHYGESLVMRLLDHSVSGSLQLNRLGLSDKNLEQLQHVLHLPYGMLLVTGPTGSGKTTTLYAALNTINHESVKIITVEDPVEYHLPRVNQIQVNTAINLDFATVLRSALRQDPDIIMIGEIRDLETASIATRSALTGHLVLATIHTNDAASTVSRLVDMGVPSYLIAAGLRAIVAQRLIRRICSSCKVQATPSGREIALLHKHFGDKVKASHFSIGKGCSYCRNTGFQGRVGIFEVLVLGGELLALLSEGDLSALSLKIDKQLAGQKLADHAFELACEGVTALREVFHVVGDMDLEWEANA